MRYIKKFMILQIGDGIHTDNGYSMATWSFGKGRNSKTENEFDTEEEAIKWAYNKTDKARWIIVPFIRFETKENPFTELVGTIYNA